MPSVPYCKNLSLKRIFSSNLLLQRTIGKTLLKVTTFLTSETHTTSFCRFKITQLRTFGFVGRPMRRPKAQAQARIGPGSGLGPDNRARAGPVPKVRARAPRMIRLLPTERPPLSNSALQVTLKIFRCTCRTAASMKTQTTRRHSVLPSVKYPGHYPVRLRILKDQGWCGARDKRHGNRLFGRPRCRHAFFTLFFRPINSRITCAARG